MRDRDNRLLDSIVVGAGFAGLYAVFALRKHGFRVSGFEAAPDVGGCWYWNRYPGARCDTESMQYSYSFDPDLDQDWDWPKRFSAQPDILAYLGHVADRFDLRRHFSFATRVTAAVFDEGDATWSVRSDRGEVGRARFLIMATGGLSITNMPDIPSVQDFRGRSMHTGTWPDEKVDFRGLRVGVIGTGSSGIQAIPAIARDAAHVTVFQRTPNYVLPARNHPLDGKMRDAWKARYPEHRTRAREVGTVYDFSPRSALSVTAEERQAEYDRRWAEGGVNFMHAFNDLYTCDESNATAADYVRHKIRGIVRDEATAARLCPNYPIGVKRVCVASGYYESYNRPNVTLVDLRQEPIERLTESGVRTAAGDYPLDLLVFATGYDALTGAVTKIEVRGRNGEKLASKWSHAPANYAGLMTAGFPNLFIITGPGSPSVLVNVVVGIEHHVDWIVRCLDDLRRSGKATIEPQLEAERDWAELVNAQAERTIFVKGNSWYLGSNIPGKPRVFMPFVGGIGLYRKKLYELVEAGYAGFEMQAAPGARSNDRMADMPPDRTTPREPPGGRTLTAH